MSAATFEPSRAWLRKPDLFMRYRVEGRGVPMAECDLPDDIELIVASRGDEAHAFAMRDLSHPHVAQGKLAGEPYLVSF